MSQLTDQIRAAIANLDAKIADLNARLAAGPLPEDADALTAQLAASEAERQKLQARLEALQAAAVEVQPLRQAPPNTNPDED